MRLIHRVILILSAAALAMLVGNALVVHLIVGKEFRSIESSLAERNADRAVDAVSDNLAHLRGSALDWATWDSSYAFMQGEGVREFVAQNLVPQSFQGIRINLMYFVRFDGTVAWGDIRDLATGEAVDLPEMSKELLTPAQLALFSTGEGDVAATPSGILMTSRGPMLVVSAPILRADGTGPAAGLLLLGRFLDAGLVDRLGRQVHARFTLDPIDAAGVKVSGDASAGPAAPAVQEPTGELQRDRRAEAPRNREVTVGEDHLTVRTVLNDIAGKPALALETSYARTISEAGSSMVNYVIALMAAVLALAGLAILLMLNRTVVKPVARLMRRVLEARGCTAPESAASARLSAAGGTPDEIVILENEFERTIQQLDETQKRLVEQSFYTGMAELVGGMTHNVRNALTPISIKLWHIGRALDMAHLDRMEAAVGRVEAATADRQDCALAVTYLKACMEHLRTSHSTIETDIGVIGDQATQIEQIFYDHERFSRAKRQVETIDISRVVDEASKLLQNGEKIRIAVAPEVAKLPAVRGHHVVLTQVFGNLIVNAEESILASGHGTGTISIDGELVRRDGVDMVELHVSDDGQGIPEDKLDRIFERGYSTRRVHSGGIGLHWCANSLAGMGGGIWAVSDGVGRGARMVVRLPARKKVFNFDSLKETA
ncbi:hypothetical protein JL101_004405 [Skermanella rosea]|uniref:CHASE4 domain-containing protein n=1 Tax=Skermanella rosea TaxID=1817965 RepID=UPI0019339D50|nr:CHASE4 domain-containing protein [Skermanella rosea]UEM04693.1 hypothetical protein JL101_004405 [Skermanella rosea]